MNFGDMFRVLLRRWYVAVPAFLLAVVATAGAYVAFPAKYNAEVQLTLLSSRSLASQQGDGGNPYMAFSPELDAVVDLLARNLSSNQAVNQLQRLGLTYPYTAGIATNAQGPFLAIDITGKNPAEITRSMPIIINFAQARLAQMQHSSAAPKNSLIRLVLIAPPSTPTPVLKTKIEVVAGVAVLGLVGAFLLCMIIDNLMSRGVRQADDDVLTSDRVGGERPVRTEYERPRQAPRDGQEPRGHPDVARPQQGPAADRYQPGRGQGAAMPIPDSPQARYREADAEPRGAPSQYGPARDRHPESARPRQ